MDKREFDNQLLEKGQMVFLKDHSSEEPEILAIGADHQDGGGKLFRFPDSNLFIDYDEEDETEAAEEEAVTLPDPIAQMEITPGTPIELDVVVSGTTKALMILRYVSPYQITQSLKIPAMLAYPDSIPPLRFINPKKDLGELHIEPAVMN